jgi:hypothetical protein
MRRKCAVMSTGSVAFLAANVVAGVSGQLDVTKSPQELMQDYIKLIDLKPL